MAVRQGDIIRDGSEILRVEGRPVIALAGGTAFWRNLGRGDNGDDVALLQRILQMDGRGPEVVDGDFGAATEAALRAWQADHGWTAPDGDFVLGDIAVGPWPARVSSVITTPGASIAAGQPILRLTETSMVVVAQVVATERARLSMEIVAEVAFDALGRTERGTVSGMASSPTVQENGDELYEIIIDGVPLTGIPEGAQARVSFVLREARSALVVPVGAVVSGPDGRPTVRLRRAGKLIETVPVQLGVSEGAWVEVRSGLAEDDVVVLTVSEADAA